MASRPGCNPVFTLLASFTAGLQPGLQVGKSGSALTWGPPIRIIPARTERSASALVKIIIRVAYVSGDACRHVGTAYHTARGQAPPLTILFSPTANRRWDTFN